MKQIYISLSNTLKRASYNKLVNIWALDTITSLFAHRGHAVHRSSNLLQVILRHTPAAEGLCSLHSLGTGMPLALPE